MRKNANPNPNSNPNANINSNPNTNYNPHLGRIFTGSLNPEKSMEKKESCEPIFEQFPGLCSSRLPNSNPNPNSSPNPNWMTVKQIETQGPWQSQQSEVSWFS